MLERIANMNRQSHRLIAATSWTQVTFTQASSAGLHIVMAMSKALCFHRLIPMAMSKHQSPWRCQKLYVFIGGSSSLPGDGSSVATGTEAPSASLGISVDLAS